MAGELGPVRYASGSNIYAQVYQRATAKVRDVVAGAWDTLADADWGDYDIALTEQGTASGIYIGNAPAGLSLTTDAYDVVYFLRVGGSPAITDIHIANQSIGAEDANVSALSKDSTAADNAETAFDGGSYNVGGGGTVAASVTGAVGSVGTGGITAASFGASAITSTVLADNAISAAKLATGAITNAKFASGAIDATAIASNAIAAAKIATGAITSAKFAAGAIDAAAIANGAIDAATFAADVDAEILSYIVDDATRIDASALNTATGTTIPAIKTETAQILDLAATNGVIVNSFTVDGKNELQQEVEDGLAAYDPPTNTEFEARTLVAANYATASAQATAQADLDIITGANGVTLATSQPNYAPATAAALATAQADLDTLTGSDGATLATSQPNYAPATASALSSLQSTANSILEDTDEIGTNGAGLTALASATALQTVDNNVDAIKAKTDNLPSDPADQSIIIAATDAILSAVGDVPTNSELATALSGLSTFNVSSDKVQLHATQPDYAPAKAGDEMDLVDAPNATAVGVIQDGLSTHTAEDVRTEMDANSTQLAAIVEDTNELQTNQGNWLTATGFATPTNVTDARDSILSKVLKYFQLLFRSDAAIATDNATELTAVNADGGSGAGDFSNQTEAVEALRDRGDAAYTTADVSGLSTFNPASDTVKLDATQAAYAPAKAGDAMTLTAAYDVYHADILLTVDGANTQDEYTITWFKNGVAVTSGITVPTLQVVKRADGTDLISSTTPTQIGSTGSYKHDESSGRVTAGEAALAIVGATIDGSPRSFRTLVGRDSSA